MKLSTGTRSLLGMAVLASMGVGCSMRGNEAEIKALSKAVVDKTNAIQKQAEVAVRDATQQPGPQAIEALRVLLRDGDDVTQSLAVGALDASAEDTSVAIPDLIPLLEKSFGSINPATERLLSRYGDRLSSEADALVRVYRTGQYPWARASAGRLLAHCKSATVPVLEAIEQSLAEEKSQSVQLAGVRSAVTIGKATGHISLVLPILELAAKDRDEEVSRNAQAELTVLSTSDAADKPAANEP